MIVIECDGYILGEVSSLPIFSEDGEPLLVEQGMCWIINKGTKMSIIAIQTVQAGLVGVLPSLAYINTKNTVAEVTTAGYLNKEVANGTSFQLPCLAIVATRATPTSAAVAGVYNVVHSGDDWSLSASSNDQIALPAGEILVGSAGGVATPVAMSGDATIDDQGEVTLAAGSVALSNLASGIAPAAVIKFAAQYTTAGGAAAEAITVTGAVGATDRAFVQLVNDGTANVSVLSAVVTNNTLTVTFSADPGNDAVINYQIIRAAA